jgi:hypothetical protein
MDFGLLCFRKLGTSDPRLTGVGIILNDLLQKEFGAYFITQILERNSLL